MATPTYKGPGQPAADNGGFLAGLGAWFGGSTPVYAEGVRIFLFF